MLKKAEGFIFLVQLNFTAIRSKYPVIKVVLLTMYEPRTRFIGWSAMNIE